MAPDFVRRAPALAACQPRGCPSTKPSLDEGPPASQLGAGHLNPGGMGANPFGLSLPLEWCSHFVELAATWGMSVEVATLTRRFQAWDQDLGATTMNDKGDDRRIVLEHRAGVGAPDADAAPALIADHAARGEPLDPSPWADIGLCVLRSIPENRLLATAGGVAFFALMAIFPRWRRSFRSTAYSPTLMRSPTV
jgi:hypothetical protein